MSLTFSDGTSLQTNDSQPLTPPSSEPGFQVDSQGNFIQNSFVPDGAEPFSPNIDLYSLIDWSSYKDEKCDPLSLDGSGNDNALWLMDTTFSLNGNNNNNNNNVVGGNGNNASMGATPMSDDTVATTPLTSSMANINISDLPTLQTPSNNFQAPLANSINIFNNTNTLSQHTINPNNNNNINNNSNSNPISNANGIVQFASFPSQQQQQLTTATSSSTTAIFPEIPYDMAFMGCVPHFSQVSIPSPVNSTNSTNNTTTTTTATATTSHSRSRTAKGKRRLSAQEANPSSSNASTNSANTTSEESRPKRKPKPTPPPKSKSSACSEGNTTDTLDDNDPTRIEDMKRNRRLQKNRQAAQQFRARQKAHIIETEERVEQLKVNNGESAALLEILEAENRLLKEQLNYLHNFISSAVSIQNITPGTVSISSSSMDQITPPIPNNDNDNDSNNNNNNNIHSPNTNTDKKESEGAKMNSDPFITPVTLFSTSPPIPTISGNIKAEQ